MTSASWQALGTKAVLAVADAGALSEARAAVAAELAAIDRTCSRFRADSELVGLNARSGEANQVSALLFEAVTTAVDAAIGTAGLVDPTIGRTLRLAGYDRTFEVVRGRDGTLHPSFARDPDWQTIELDKRRRTVRVPAAGTRSGEIRVENGAAPARPRFAVSSARLLMALTVSVPCVE